MAKLTKPGQEDPVDKIKKTRKRYTISAKGKTSVKKYRSSTLGKVAQDRYIKSEKGRQAQLRYYHSPRGQQWKKNQAEIQKFLRRGAKWLEENPGKTISDFYEMVSKETSQVVLPKRPKAKKTLTKKDVK